MAAAGAAPFVHEPVLAQEVLRYLAPRPGGIYVDATVGGGGHAALILSQGGPGTRLIGLDRDPAALAASQDRLQTWAPNVALRRGNFAQLEALVAPVLEAWGVSGVDGVLFDLGVSSPQLDNPQRGFTYRADAPLDMRMDPTQGPTAADLVNRLSAAELRRILWEYGEERWAPRIAAFIEDRRRRAPILTTGELEDVVKAAIPARARRAGGHPARRTFQALRIAVNGELEALTLALPQAVRLLRPGGRLVVISFHSLEDRLVKRTLAALAGGAADRETWPHGASGGLLRLLTRKPVVPTEDEVARNSRARSAKLRAAERIGANPAGAEEAPEPDR